MPVISIVNTLIINFSVVFKWQWQIANSLLVVSVVTRSCVFSPDQLQKALNKQVLEKFEERQQEEAINLADLPDLVR